MVAAIERGWVQREMEDAAYLHQQAVDGGENVVVGVNRFISPDGDSACLADQEVDQTAQRRQIERVRALRAPARSPALAGGSRPGHGTGPLHRQPDAGDPGGGGKLRYRGRDRRQLAPGLQRIPAALRKETLSASVKRLKDVHRARGQQGHGGEGSRWIAPSWLPSPNRESTGESVGEKAVLVLNARNK